MSLANRELETTRSVRLRDPLSKFFRSQSRWELLLLIATNKGKSEIGMWGYIELLATRTESQMTIYNFIRDRIGDGTLILTPGQKKSRKVLSLSPKIEEALNEFLQERFSHKDMESQRNTLPYMIETVTTIQTAPDVHTIEFFRDPAIYDYAPDPFIAKAEA